MSLHMNKKVIAVAIGGLFAAAGAQAEVIISAPTVVPAAIASEAVVATTGTTFTNVGGTLNLRTALKYSFSDTEVRYARIECAPHIRFLAGSAVVPSDLASTAVGAINGLGTNAINFSITAVGNGLTATDELSITGNRSLIENKSGNCTYGLYDQPSQAAAGGTIGRIAVVADKPYLVSAPSYGAKVTSNTVVANVEAVPAFSDFVVGPNSGLNTARLALIEFNLISIVDPTKTQPILPSGLPGTLADLLGSSTTHKVAGDWSAAANANGTYTGAAALGRVYLAGGGCVAPGVPATSLSATEAAWETGDVPVSLELCFTPLADVAIPASTYQFSTDAVSEDSDLYTTPDLGPLASGEIQRNGTTLQAPLAQVTPGWISRMALTNTGTIDRPYTITVFGEDGNTLGTANLTGIAKAGKTTVVDLTTVITSYTGAPRATLNVVVSGPNAQIQGLYQIVNGATGSISNHVMVRPGTN